MNNTPERRVQFTNTNPSRDGRRFPPWLLGVCILLLLAVIGTGVFVYARYSVQAQGPSKIALAKLLQMNPAELLKSVTGQSPAFVDALDGSNPGAWDLYEQNGGGCIFKNKSLHVIVPPQTFATSCYLRNEFLTNFAFQVQMQMGPTSATQQIRQGGIMFRVHLIQQEAYEFLINTSSNGNTVSTQMQLALLIPNKSPVVLTSQSDVVLNDLASPKLLTLIALQDKFNVYINGKPFPTVSDPTFQGGQLGVFASSDTGFETLFQNAKLWIL